MSESRNGRNVILGILSSILVALVLFMLGGGRMLFAELRATDDKLRDKNEEQDALIADVNITLSRVETDVSWIRKKLEE